MATISERLRESAQQIDNDGTPSQVGMSPDELRAVADVFVYLAYALEPFAQRCREFVRADDSDTDGITVRTKHLREAVTALALARGEK